MKYAIIGTGAIGGYYGGMLARYGHDIHFLFRSDFSYVKEHGLKIDSINGNFILPKVNAYSSPTEMPKCDAAIITLKTTQNGELAKILPNILKKDGIIITLQNGLGFEKDIASILPEAVILSGICNIASNKVGPGHINHMYYGKITLAEYLPEYKIAGLTENLIKVTDDFRNAGLTVDLNKNLGEMRWKKLVWNIPYNGLSVVLKCTTDKLMKHKSTRELIKIIMEEVISGANACGFAVDRKFADEMFTHTEKIHGYKTSMLIDYESSKPMEIDTMYLRPIRLAENAGYSMTTVKALTLELEFLADRI